MIGAVRHVSDNECDLLRIELFSEEAVKTSQIEGEMLDRLITGDERSQPP
ncbi:DUF4172 domain-containing protein [Rhizobium sp. LCM 4573]